MGTLLLWLCIASICLLSLKKPWVGVVAYYFLALLGPQYIWWWVFEGIRVSLIIVLFTFIGVVFSFFKNSYKISFFKNKLNFWVIVLWAAIVVSYFFGAHVGEYNSSQLSPDFVFSLTNNICLFYLVSTLEMNEIKKLRYLAIVICVSLAYLSYWANDQYFSSQWSQFYMGRLMGPSSIYGTSIYHDTNYFSMFFVVSLPFLYYLAFEIQNKFLRFIVWIIAPLSIHAIFLTGSRGGLLGVGVIAFSILLFSRRKVLILPLFLLLLMFYQWQAGDVMKSRSRQIVNIEGEKSAGDRLTAWQGGLNMVLTHPITGVGVGFFETALPQYVESRNMVAHNTLVQFSAESGFFAGLAYLLLAVVFFKRSFMVRSICRLNERDEDCRIIELYNNASTASFAGFFLCSMFLSLNSSELLFILLLFNNSLYQICHHMTYDIKHDFKNGASREALY